MIGELSSFASFCKGLYLLIFLRGLLVAIIVSKQWQHLSVEGVLGLSLKSYKKRYSPSFSKDSGMRNNELYISVHRQL